MKACKGTVYLVGAGPGDPGLMTVRGMNLLRTADVVVYDRLAGSELLGWAGDDAEVIDVGKAPDDHRVTQDEINTILVSRAKAGRSVVRLKGGDPFLFGRGFEEVVACGREGVACVVVPGVTSATSVPAMAGIPVTLRGVARSFAVITAKIGPGFCSSHPDYAALARIDTLVILMGRHKLSSIIEGLRGAGRADDTPVACISSGTTPQQREVISTLSEIVAQVDRAALTAPMITIVGEVVAVSRADDVEQAVRRIYPDVFV